jgi:hypothetical protein
MLIKMVLGFFSISNIKKKKKKKKKKKHGYERAYLPSLTAPGAKQQLMSSK